MSSTRKRSQSGPVVVGYAKRLSPYSHKGRCGDELPEAQESAESVAAKVKILAGLVRSAAYCVAHTGAGISTAAGIPDFRGSHGMWTREKQGHPLPRQEPFWSNAVPTLGHMALLGLMQAGRLQYVVTQNIDGLHLRSGIPRSKLSELHGNMLLEVCESCGFEVLRTCDVGGIGLKPTGRSCPNPRCRFRLRDALLDWEDNLPETDFRRALEEAGNCRAPWEEKTAGGKGAGGLALCLGTSMQMAPARELPCEAGRMVIVNLQPTEYDADCYLNVRARIDDVLHGLMRELGLRIPVYERWETIHLHHQVSVKHKTAAGEDAGCAFHVTYRLSVGESTLLHGAPSGYLSRVTLRLPPALGGGEVVLASQPFTHSARSVVRRPSHACSTCAPTTGGADADGGAASGMWEEVGVTVDFEPTPPIRAGVAVLPSSTSPAWRGAYSLPLHKAKDAGSRAERVCLVTVDYNELYRQ